MAAPFYQSEENAKEVLAMRTREEGDRSKDKREESGSQIALL
jgi:hypothetical protein